jgi:hypothetical protein
MLVVRVLNRSNREFPLDMKTVSPQNLDFSAMRFHPYEKPTGTLPTMEQVLKGEVRGNPLMDRDLLRGSFSATIAELYLPNNPAVLPPLAYIGIRYRLPTLQVCFFDKLVASALASPKDECWGLDVIGLLKVSSPQGKPVTFPAKSTRWFGLGSNHVFWFFANFSG